MAEIVWTDPALLDLDRIAEYIAIENPEAAAKFVKRVFARARQLIEHPESGSLPMELRDSHIRQIVEPPCRIFYTFDGKICLVLYILRFEQQLRISRLDDID